MNGVELAVKAVGGRRELANLLGLSRQAVYQWRRVPSDHLALVAKLTRISPQRLRPDLFKVKKTA